MEEDETAHSFQKTTDSKSQLSDTYIHDKNYNARQNEQK